MRDDESRKSAYTASDLVDIRRVGVDANPSHDFLRERVDLRGRHVGGGHRVKQQCLGEERTVRPRVEEPVQVPRIGLTDRDEHVGDEGERGVGPLRLVVGCGRRIDVARRGLFGGRSDRRAPRSRRSRRSASGRAAGAGSRPPGRARPWARSTPSWPPSRSPASRTPRARAPRRRRPPSTRSRPSRAGARRGRPRLGQTTSSILAGMRTAVARPRHLQEGRAAARCGSVSCSVQASTGNRSRGRSWS